MKLPALPLYAAAHFWVDFACAMLVLGRLEGGGDAVTALLLYNCFAFAVQMPVGLLATPWGLGSGLPPWAVASPPWPGGCPACSQPPSAPGWATPAFTWGAESIPWAAAGNAAPWDSLSHRGP